MNRRPLKLSLSEARRIALAAQGFAKPRGASRPTRARILGLFDRIGLIQLDSVNVLVRSHYLPAFSRLGAYDVTHLETAAYRAPRALFEYWGHEASLLPVALQPLLRWRMARAEHEAWGHIRRIQKEKPGFVAEILEEVRAKGPLAASELTHERPKRAGSWWEWHDGKTALEWLFWSGQVTCAERVGFERRYDLPERVLPDAIARAKTPSPEDAQRELMRISARAMGVAVERDLRDYFRFSLKDSRRAVAELVELGELLPAQVEGWTAPAYLARDAKGPATVDACALLSPFDSVVWQRARTHRLFDFHLRLELYTPEHKRIHGYYVLPFLLGDTLVARVDLKSDRAAQQLLVKAAYLEPGKPAARVAPPLTQELSRLAAWLGLTKVSYGRRGDLMPALRKAAAQR